MVDTVPLKDGDPCVENGVVNQEALILTHTESRIKTAMEISTTRSRNWIVLLQRIVTSVPQWNNLKSVLSCLEGLKSVAFVGSKCNFQKKP